LGREDRTVPLVDPVADRLPDEVRADRPHPEAVPLEQLAAALRVRRVGDRLVDLEMVAPARELEPVEAPLTAFRGELLDRQIGPLAGEQRDWTTHRCSFQGDGTGSASPAAPSSDIG